MRFKKAGANNYGAYNLYECPMRTGREDKIHESKFDKA